MDRARGQPRVLGHETERTDLRIVTDGDIDADDAADPDRDVAAQRHGACLEDPASAAQCGVRVSTDNTSDTAISTMMIHSRISMRRVAARSTILP